ncbi:UNVERIFIED_ORG: hypothetical protein J2Y76_004512 [Pseudomonas reinekei]|uniref:hypothetical protein n=1 Tax=Pseudomonas laurylsulfatiphila TaxID=2011015 RepID=UPI003D24C47B|nr:hypothetical protein [Pseudomonas reinekei]
MKVLAGIVGGLVLALLVMTVFGISNAALPESAGGGAIAFFIAWIIGLVVAITAPRAGKAWRRLLITSGVVSFMLPLAGIVFTGSHIVKNVNPSTGHSGAEAAGALIGGTLVSGFLGFVGFFLGVIFCMVGLLVGRDKQIVYVQATLPENH